MLSLLGFFVGFISCGIVGILLGTNHITRVIGIIIGALQCYVLFYLGIGPDGALGWLIVGSLVLVLFAACFAIYEVGCLIGFVLELLGVDIDTSSEPSPYSHAMGGLANWLSSFFR